MTTVDSPTARTSASAEDDRDWVTFAEFSRELLGHPTIQFLLVVLIAFIPRAVSAGHFYTTDEALWMERSNRLITAIIHVDPANASSTVSGQATMPGITTAWVGGVARLIWDGFDALGIHDSTDLPFTSSPFGFEIAQVLSAAASALLIGALWWVLVRWTSPTAAAVTAVLLATEPFLVGHGAVLHTDSFVMLFGALGTFALLAVADVPKGNPLKSRDQPLMAVLAGVGLAGSVLTKLNALTFAPFALVIVVIAGVRASRAGELRRLVVTLGVVAAAGVMFTLVLWPAIWADPLGQLEVMRSSLSAQAGSGHPNFFLGEIVGGGPIFYYFVAVPFRMTPWFLVLTVVSVVGTLVMRETRRQALAVLGSIAVPWLAISTAGQKFDRYGTMVWPALAVLVGLLIAALLDRARARRPLRPGVLGAVGAALAGLLFVNTLVIAPYNLSYFNPLLGGSTTARDALLVGWGEGLEQAGEIIENVEGGCTHRRVLTSYALKPAFPCEQMVPPQDAHLLEPGDYIVLYVNYEQRTEPEQLQALRRAGTRVGEVRIRGIRYADVIRVERPVENPVENPDGGS